MMDFAQNALRHRSAGSNAAGMDNERLSRLEGAVEGVKFARPLTFTVLVLIVTVLGLNLAATIGGFAWFGSQLGRVESRMDRLDAKLDAIPSVIRDEFRAMRAEMSAQTSAIANSITAARAPAPPIVIQAPAPQPTPAPDPSK